MAEEIKDVNKVEAETTTESTEENKQTEKPAEGVTPPVDGKDYKAIAEQLSRDIKEKNRKIQELKGQPQKEAITEDETVKRFIETEKRSIKAEANYEILMKVQTDPSFKERVDIVKDYVEQGYTLEMADKLAKADIMDKILAESSKGEVQVNKPKQIETQAVPEKKTFEETGNPLKDFLNNPDVPEAAKEAAKRYF